MIDTHRIVRIVIGIAAAATLVSCAADPAPPPSGASGTTTSVDPVHNAADVAFAQGMTPHHAQAVTMSRQAVQQAASAEVRDLAQSISSAQGPEIDLMNRMLAAWGAPPAAGTPGMDHGPMTGMMTDGQMAQLAARSGPSFDRMFLEMMTAHHEGAVEMARAELAQGRNPQAEQLAQSIIEAQQAELATMRSLLSRR